MNILEGYMLSIRNRGGLSFGLKVKLEKHHSNFRNSNRNAAWAGFLAKLSVKNIIELSSTKLINNANQAPSIITDGEQQLLEKQPGVMHLPELLSQLFASAVNHQKVLKAALKNGDVKSELLKMLSNNDQFKIDYSANANLLKKLILKTTVPAERKELLTGLWKNSAVDNQSEAFVNFWVKDPVIYSIISNTNVTDESSFLQSALSNNGADADAEAVNTNTAVSNASKQFKASSRIVFNQILLKIDSNDSALYDLNSDKLLKDTNQNIIKQLASAPKDLGLVEILEAKIKTATNKLKLFLTKHLPSTAKSLYRLGMEPPVTRNFITRVANLIKENSEENQVIIAPEVPHVAPESSPIKINHDAALKLTPKKRNVNHEAAFKSTPEEKTVNHEAAFKSTPPTTPDVVAHKIALASTPETKGVDKKPPSNILKVINSLGPSRPDTVTRAMREDSKKLTRSASPRSFTGTGDENLKPQVIKGRHAAAFFSTPPRQRIVEVGPRVQTHTPTRRALFSRAQTASPY